MVNGCSQLLLTPEVFPSSPLKAMVVGKQIGLSYWVSATFQGQTLKLRGIPQNLLGSESIDQTTYLGNSLEYHPRTNGYVVIVTMVVVPFRIGLWDPFQMAELYGLYMGVTNPRDPITLPDDDWGVQSPPKCKVFRFHCHSHTVIGSLG